MRVSRNLAEVVNWGNVQMCAIFALGSQPSTAPLSDWYQFCFKLKLALWVTRGCALIHVGCSVCKFAGLKAQSDHQNPKKVALHGKTAYVGLHPQLVDRFTPLLLQWCVCIIVVNNRVHAACNQTYLPKPATFKLRCYQLPLKTELDFAGSGHRTQFTFQKYPCLGPQMTTSGNLVVYPVACAGARGCYSP